MLTVNLIILVTLLLVGIGIYILGRIVGAVAKLLLTILALLIETAALIILCLTCLALLRL